MPLRKFSGRRLESLAFIGGGAKSALWSQIHADVLGREIRQMKEPRLANVRGAALLTLLALGRISVDEIPGLVEVELCYLPDPTVTASGEYHVLFEQFVALYKQNKGIYRRLNSALTE